MHKPVRRRLWTIYGTGRCRVCGSPLRGLTGVRCPECATVYDLRDWLVANEGLPYGNHSRAEETSANVAELE
jgi:hypothetical protein